tara:strand:+ start:6413 stop:7327 length:915 start_codon:yes stop_codon:yes gene_type:complete
MSSEEDRPKNMMESEPDKLILLTPLTTIVVETIHAYIKIKLIKEGDSVDEYYNKFICDTNLHPGYENFTLIIGLETDWRSDNDVWTSFRPMPITGYKLKKLANIEAFLFTNTVTRLRSVIALYMESILHGTITDLKEHIESQLPEEWTWENHGEVWHIDHVIPLLYYGDEDKTSLTVFDIINRFHYKNHQPLAVADNLAKGNRNCNRLLDYIKSRKPQRRTDNAPVDDKVVRAPVPVREPVAVNTDLLWVSNNPPINQENRTDYYRRYVADGGIKSNVAFGRIIAQTGFEKAHSGNVRYYRKKL